MRRLSLHESRMPIGLAMGLLVALSHCRRTSPERGVTGDDSGAAHPDAAQLPKPLGTIERLVGTAFGACALTSTGRVWCFTSMDDGRIVDELDDVADLVGFVHGAATTECPLCTLCALSRDSVVECATNARSKSLAALCKRPKANGTSCGAPPDGFAARDVRWIGGFAAPIDPLVPNTEIQWSSLVVGLTHEAVLLRADDRNSKGCCHDLTTGTCEPGAVGGACLWHVPYSDSPSDWQSGLAHMSDGSFRNWPLRATDEVKAVGRARKIAQYSLYGGGGAACAIAEDGRLRCEGEPWDLPWGLGPRPAYRDWHDIVVPEGVTDLAISGGNGLQAACALVAGVPWCWGAEVYLDAGAGGWLGLPAPSQTCTFATTADASNPTNTQSYPCERTPKRRVGIAGATRIVSLGFDDSLRYNFCALTKAGQIDCWGRGTKGRVERIQTPSSEHTEQ